MEGTELQKRAGSDDNTVIFFFFFFFMKVYVLPLEVP